MLRGFRARGLGSRQNIGFWVPILLVFVAVVVVAAVVLAAVLGVVAVVLVVAVMVMVMAMYGAHVDVDDVVGVMTLATTATPSTVMMIITRLV